MSGYNLEERAERIKQISEDIELRLADPNAGNCEFNRDSQLAAALIFVACKIGADAGEGEKKAFCRHLKQMAALVEET